jgi:hypothetical protein
MRWFLLLLLAPVAFAADPVDADRLPHGGTWQGKVGLIDVDPTTYTKHNVSTANGGSDATGTMQTTATAAQINAAIAAAADGSKYIELAAGTFSPSGNISLTSSRVSLRGQVNADGRPSTIFKFANPTDYVVMNKTAWDADNAAHYTMRTISSGHTRGSTTLTLTAAPTGLTTGRLLIIVAPANVPTIDGDGGFSDWLSGTAAPDGSFPFSQIVRVAGVSGSDVTITPAINSDYISGLTCRVYYRDASAQLDFSGLENIQLEVDGNGFFAAKAIEMYGLNQCWVRNCFFERIGIAASLNAFIFPYITHNLEISRCRFRKCSDPGNSGLYSMASLHCSGMLVVNNEFAETSNVFPIIATSGSVFAYNYCHDMLYGAFLSQWVFHHGSHNHYNLFEGNYIQGQHYNDASDTGNFTHSRASLYFRERIVSYDNSGNATGFPMANVNAIVCQDHHDLVTVAGCVMGTDGKGTAVTGGNGTNQGENLGYIYNFDATSAATLQKFANHNRFDDAIPAEEALDPGDALVNSYLYSSKPAWFGNRPWPWVDPENYTQSNNHANLPAGYRAIYGFDPPEGVDTANTIVATTMEVSTLAAGGPLPVNTVTKTFESYEVGAPLELAANWEIRKGTWLTLTGGILASNTLGYFGVASYEPVALIAGADRSVEVILGGITPMGTSHAHGCTAAIQSSGECYYLAADDNLQMFFGYLDASGNNSSVLTIDTAFTLAGTRLRLTCSGTGASRVCTAEYNFGAGWVTPSGGGNRDFGSGKRLEGGRSGVFGYSNARTIGVTSITITNL